MYARHGSSSIIPNSQIFVMVVRAEWGLHCPAAKFHELVLTVEDKDPHRLSPFEHLIKLSTNYGCRNCGNERRDAFTVYT